MPVTVSKYLDATDVAENVACALLKRLVELQSKQDVVQLCLTGGRIAQRIYSELARQVGGSLLDVSRLELWWGDERFVETSDPLRNAGPALAALASAFPLDPAMTHPMPAAEGVLDAAASAAAYAKELDDTTFDICLLGMGEDGHVASIFPNHPSFQVRTATVMGVSESPKPPSERISLTLPTLNKSSEVWLLISGSDKAEAVKNAIAGDETIPAGVVRGVQDTRFFVDRDAAKLLPNFECSL